MTQHNDCGFNHLTEEQKNLLMTDAAEIFAQLIQDTYHSNMPTEVALGLGQAAVGAGIQQINYTLQNALKLNQLSARIVINGFAEDAKT